MFFGADHFDAVDVAHDATSSDCGVMEGLLFDCFDPIGIAMYARNRADSMYAQVCVIRLDNLAPNRLKGVINAVLEVDTIVNDDSVGACFDDVVDAVFMVSI